MIKNGATYAYHVDTTEEIVDAASKEQLEFNSAMRRVAAEDNLIDEYFENGPPRYRYDVMRKLLT